LFEKSATSELVGIDLSGEMLDIAKSKARVQQSKAKFIQGDISRISEYVENLYDFIFSSTTTHYIFDLGKLFNSIAEKLKPNGCSILSIIHPLYSAMYPIKHGNAFPDDNDWKIKYLDKNERSYIQPWIEYNDSFDNRLSMSYHHLFSDYINAIVHAGLKVCEIREPVPPEKWKTDCPDRYNGFIDTPIFISNLSSSFELRIYKSTEVLGKGNIIIKRRVQFRKNYIGKNIKRNDALSIVPYGC
jgi:SAM-dependent methyltransferase